MIVLRFFSVVKFFLPFCTRQFGSVFREFYSFCSSICLSSSRSILTKYLSLEALPLLVTMNSTITLLTRSAEYPHTQTIVQVALNFRSFQIINQTPPIPWHVISHITLNSTTLKISIRVETIPNSVKFRLQAISRESLEWFLSLLQQFVRLEESGQEQKQRTISMWKEYLCGLFRCGDTRKFRLTQVYGPLKCCISQPVTFPKLPPQYQYLA